MRFRAFILVLLVAALTLSSVGCATQSREMKLKLRQMARTPHTEAEYQVAPPDELAVDVKGYPEYSRTVIVRPDGKITVPGMGDLYVQGQTLPAISAAITEGLSKELTQPVVTVTLMAARSKAVYVLGEVRNPGVFPYYGDMKLLDAVGAARGLTLYANERKIRVTRESLDQPSLYKVNLVDLIKNGSAEQDMVLRDGDIIYVPPTPLAKVGYAFDQLLFPFRSLLGGIATYGGVRNAFDNRP